MTIDVGFARGKARTRAIKAGQRRILKESLKHLSDKLMACLKNLPEDWDGFEIRWLVAKAAEYNGHNPDKARKREFENTCNNKNLPW